MRTPSSIFLPVALICLPLLWWGNGRGDDDKSSPSPGWSTQSSGTNSHLHGVSFVDADNGWTVGSNGTILRYFNK